MGELDRDGLRSRARWAQIVLAVIVVVDLAAVFSDIAEYRLLNTDFTIAEADANDTRQAAIGSLQIALYVAGAVFFIRWFKRAYENVDVLDGNRRYGVGWAIGAWFVPILNLWRPKQIANDIWRATNPRDASDDVSPVLTGWWAAFLISNWIGQVVFRLSWNAETLEDFQTAAIVNAVANGVDLVAALLAIWVVRTITARQVGAAPAQLRLEAIDRH